MNDEIREILDYLKNDDYSPVFADEGCDDTPYKLFDETEVKLLLDYITNLQQENIKLISENEAIKNIKYTVDEVIYKSRINKAIEHIEKHQFIFQSQYGDESNFDNHLLDILKNGDDENEEK